MRPLVFLNSDQHAASGLFFKSVIDLRDSLSLSIFLIKVCKYKENIESRRQIARSASWPLTLIPRRPLKHSPRAMRPRSGRFCGRATVCCSFDVICHRPKIIVEGWLFFLGQIPSKKKKGRLPRVEFSPVIFEAVKRRMRCNYLLLIIGRWTLYCPVRYWKYLFARIKCFVRWHVAISKWALNRNACVWLMHSV